MDYDKEFANISAVNFDDTEEKEEEIGEVKEKEEEEDLEEETGDDY